MADRDRRRIMQETFLNALPVTPETPWWWLSFADDDGFCGVCIVQGVDVAAAIARAHLLKINPGGEIASVKIPPEELHKIEPRYRNVLLDKETLVGKLHAESVML